MITFSSMTIGDAQQIRQIDRSEFIGRYYKCQDGILKEIAAGHECPNWSDGDYAEMIARYEDELRNGGAAYGAYDGETLVGFGVLAHKFRGADNDQLQLDLMYVSRNYRRQGIGRRILEALSREAVAKGAKSLYISATETESAVKFYMSCGSDMTDSVDAELFAKEPLDIHMVKRL
ncbi:GNAT family N-acetyltransferase [Paenibacillus sp. NFR01]|uniref:GNAT family N-acetyltransferase n=1 Tax=Paenibacillus sp. NFR01 TaxID=1566279 RepID=UPI0008BE3C91|nr:GNAT family N-acetyltransferase [Paenibacillus sp. NFR01]SET09080.1 Ribosomal protein S18 acetylase RimI [Paenibacillus sp. NFR01]